MPKRKGQSRTSAIMAYTDPQTPGVLGGVTRYAKVQGLILGEAHKKLQGELASRSGGDAMSQEVEWWEPIPVDSH